ncbi:MAG: hypothetical protein U1G07_15580 [Verrucomicrobiota bacterium]
MNRLWVSFWTGSALLTLSAAELPEEHGKAPQPSPYARWQKGPSADESYFPIAVWLQNPRNAARYKDAGINLYVGLWRGPTRQQLQELAAAGLQVICEQNRTALEDVDNRTIVGWMHGDEPDNAQALPGRDGYGPPIPTEKIRKEYEELQAKDPTRPILLNLGQGVAWDNYIGRGVRRNHPEDYPEYVKGCDIASFDIYPVVHDSPEIAGKLEMVAHGVERLGQWAGPTRITWNCIECTHISRPPAKATPDQIRSEVWMALIHGSRGLIYFVHQFKPTFNEAALLDDPLTLTAVTAINRQIHALAPVLNGPTLAGELTIQSAPSTGEGRGLAAMVKRRGSSTYVFTVNLQNRAVSANLVLKSIKGDRGVIVLDEGRTVPSHEGAFTDQFKPYEVHLYQVRQDG